MSVAARGLAAMLGCCLIWGLSPLYYKLLSHVPATEVLAHRTLWSAAFLVVVLAFQGRPGAVRTALAPGRRGLLLTLAAAMTISVNWLLFIWSIQVGVALQASFGYYIFPLLAVALGVAAFGERLSRAAAVAVALAVAAVGVLTVGLGAPPVVALALAASFAAYGALKRLSPVGAVVSVTAEVLLLAPLAGVWLFAVVGWPAAPGTALLLIASGPLTATPLMLFSYAARRLAMTTVGLMQYLNPTLQMLCATLAFGEPFGPWQAAGFGLIWIALALYSADGLRRQRSARRRATAAAASGARVT
ncbi:EamA family transporter RarD [Rhodobacteraceae bacterium CCMM004]|nr:EamA family transporter RarD [Rhodobacteraceae bacterium CCMM004]